MSLTIGIYDLFAYTIPGFLYLFVINEFFRLIGWNYLQLNRIRQGDSLILVTFAILCAYITGHLFDFFAQWFNRLLSSRKPPEVALTRIAERFPTFGVKFGSRDWEVLLALLRQRAHEYSNVIETYGATSILHTNICFGLLLLAMLQIYQMILGYSPVALAVTIGIVVLCYAAYRRSRMFSVWFYREIYEASLHYGNSLEEVVAYGKERKPLPLNKTRKVKSGRK